MSKKKSQGRKPGPGRPKASARNGPPSGPDNGQVSSGPDQRTRPENLVAAEFGAADTGDTIRIQKMAMARP